MAGYFLILPIMMVSILKISSLVPPVEVEHEEIIVQAAPTFEEFERRLFATLRLATQAKQDSVTVNAGKLHRAIGGYPGPNHRMPMCCQAMRNEMRPNDIILDEPKHGQGASFTVKYMLPRNESNSEDINRQFLETVEEARRLLDKSGKSQRPGAPYLAASSPDVG